MLELLLVAIVFMKKKKVRKRERQGRDFKKAKEEAGRIIRTTSVIQKELMEALNKVLGVDMQKTGLYVHSEGCTSKVC